MCAQSWNDATLLDSPLQARLRESLTKSMTARLAARPDIAEKRVYLLPLRPFERISYDSGFWCSDSELSDQRETAHTSTRVSRSSVQRQREPGVLYCH